jgi:hypothetical protein
MDVVGFDGQVNARNFSRLIANTGSPVGVVLSRDDGKVTAATGRRAVQIAPGGMQSGLIWAQETAAQTLPDFSVPTAGQFYLICNEHRFPIGATKGTVTRVALPGETRSSQTPPDALPPFPAAFRGNLSQVGSDVWHVPLAWVFVRRQDNLVTIWDLRVLRSGMPAQLAESSGVLTYPRGGTGYDAWAKGTVATLSSNSADPLRLNMPGGKYEITAQYSLGATTQGIGALRVEVSGATTANISSDIRADLGAHSIIGWSKTIDHPGGTLRVDAKALVDTPNSTGISGTVQNGTGFLQIRFAGRFAE